MGMYMANHRQTWTQRNAKDPPIKWVKQLASISLWQTTEDDNVMGRCLGPEEEQRMSRPANLLGFDGREAIGWILGAGQHLEINATILRRITVVRRATDYVTANFNVYDLGSPRMDFG